MRDLGDGTKVPNSFMFHNTLHAEPKDNFYTVFLVYLHFDYDLSSYEVRCGFFDLCHAGTQKVMDFGAFWIYGS